MGPQPLRVQSLRYDALIGTGGIGSGASFALSGSHTLGREESRGGRFLGRRDYCKLHIIAHYVKTLLGPSFTVLPIGKVGQDEFGARLLAEMKAIGLGMEYVQSVPGGQTLYSLCFVYPDGSGGNMTTDDSASSQVDETCVREAEPAFAQYGPRGIALAVAEVPLAARLALLDLGTKYGFFRAASFTTEEILAMPDKDVFRGIDLLAVNLDEAVAILGEAAGGEDRERLVPYVIRELAALNADLKVSITAGGWGSWAWDGTELAHQDRIDVPVASTAGAGDAHLSGLLVGMAAGLTVHEAHALASLVAAMSVTSQHTIHSQIDRVGLKTLARSAKVRLSKDTRDLLEV